MHIIQNKNSVFLDNLNLSSLLKYRHTQHKVFVIVDKQSCYVQ